MKKTFNAIIRNRKHATISILFLFLSSLFLNHYTNNVDNNVNRWILPFWFIGFSFLHLAIGSILYARANLIHKKLKYAIFPLIILFYITLTAPVIYRPYLPDPLFIFSFFILILIFLTLMVTSLYILIKRID